MEFLLLVLDQSALILSLLFSLPISVMRELLNVMHHAVGLPLRVYFLLSSKGETIQPFVVLDIAEHFRGKTVLFVHGSICSVIGASSRPGAIQGSFACTSH